MVSVRPRDRTLVAAAACVAFLLAFGAYIWTSTEVYRDESGRPLRSGDAPRLKAGAPGAGPGGRLEAALRLEQSAVAQASSLPDGRQDAGATTGPVAARLCLRNAGAAPLALLDAPLPSALVDVRLFYLGPDGSLPPRRVWVTAPAPVSPAARAAGGPSVVVRLLPGRELCIPLPLTPLFDLRARGKYRLEATYQPAVYAAAWQLDPAQLGVEDAKTQAQALDFEVQ